jgi:hypothetical protein
MGKNFERSGCGFIQLVSRHLSGETEENYKKISVRWMVPWPEFGLSTMSAMTRPPSSVTLFKILLRPKKIYSNVKV